MKLDLHLYPTLDDELFENSMILVSNPRFTYINALDGKEKEIEYENNDSNIISLEDKGGAWQAAFDNLSISQQIKILNPTKLFGTSGLALKDASIGVGIVWSSRDSRQRSAQKIGTFRFKEGVESFSARLNFTKKQLRKKLNYKLVLFIEDVGSEEDTYLANEYGLILGSIYEADIHLEGDASTFQIVSIEDKDSPLWSLKCEWNEITDLYEDSVLLRINKEHKDYALLNMDSPRYNSKLFEQILANVVVIMVQTAVTRQEITHIMEEDSLPVGTIGNLIAYYIDSFNINYDSPSSIFDSVMAHLWR